MLDMGSFSFYTRQKKTLYCIGLWQDLNLFWTSQLLQTQFNRINLSHQIHIFLVSWHSWVAPHLFFQKHPTPGAVFKNVRLQRPHQLARLADIFPGYMRVTVEMMMLSSPDHKVGPQNQLYVEIQLL